MSRILVAYYSWTGVTAKLARAIADGLAADLEEIREIKSRRMPLGAFRGVFEVLTKRRPALASQQKNAADYDLVVLGFPVWAATMASPMRSYAIGEGARAKAIAAFCTLGGSGGEDAMTKLQAALGRKLEAQLIVDAAALKSGDWKAQADAFVRGLKLTLEREARGDAA